MSITVTGALTAKLKEENKTDNFNFGVHTYAVSKVLTSKQYFEIKSSFNGKCDCSGNYFTSNEEIYFHRFSKMGIKIYLSRSESIYTLKVRLEPCRILNSENPAALYQPMKKSYNKIVDKADKLLESINIPYAIDKMKICRMDCTVDLYLQSKDITLGYIRILKKGCILPHYKKDCFKENEKKAKDIAEANKHSFRQSCKSAAFFTYDKTAQLQMTDRLTEQLVDKNVLRLEAELKRPAMKKHLGKLDSNYHYLKNGAKQGSKIIKWYLKRMLKTLSAGTSLLSKLLI